MPTYKDLINTRLSKKKPTDEAQSTSSSTAAIIAEESAPSPLLCLPDELWHNVFRFIKHVKTVSQKESAPSVEASPSSAEQSAEPAEGFFQPSERSEQLAATVNMLPHKLRELSKRFQAIYDSTLSPQFFATFKPIPYDDGQYRLQIHQERDPSPGEVYLWLENDELKFHLQTLKGQKIHGTLETELRSLISNDVIYDCKEDIHRELSSIVQLHEVKANLIEEMDKLLENEETILANNGQAAALQRRFDRLKALRQKGLNSTFNCLECEHHLEHINADIVQAQILEAYSKIHLNKVWLDCSFCRLTRFPKTALTRKENATFWQQLKRLDLNNNQLQSLPAEIEKLVALEFLNLNDNQFQSLPNAITQLVTLESLFLEHNQLQSLPAEIGQLVALKTLFLEDNQLKSLPVEIGKLVALEWLILGYNQLKSLPAEIGQLGMLERFHINHNQLQSLPAEIGQLLRLKLFSLHHNQLQTLPAQVGQLVALRRLRLSNNCLQSVPAGVGQLLLLEWLYLDHNYLHDLPAEMAQLPRLKLILEHNHFQSLPAWLDENNLYGLYEEDVIVKPSMAAILATQEYIEANEIKRNSLPSL